MSFTQLLAILNAHKLIALWVFTLTVVVTTVVTFILPKTYTATTTVVINAKGADPITGAMLPSSLMPGYVATQKDIIESRNVALKVVDDLRITKSTVGKVRFESETKGEGDINVWWAEELLKSLDVKPSRESNIIEINFKGADADFASIVANAFATAYIDTSLQLKIEPSKKAAQFFEGQIKELRSNVEKAQAKLSAFQKEHQITSTEDKLDVEMARLSELSSQLVAAQAQTYDSNSRRIQLGKGAASESPEILSNPLIQGLKSQLVQAQARLSDASQRLGVNHPAYQSALQDVKNIKNSIQVEMAKASGGVGQSAKVSQLREGEIKAALEAQKQRILKLKSEQDEMAVLSREADSAQRIFDNMLLRYGQTNMESHSGQTDIYVLNPATPPMKHTSPKRAMNVILSIFLGGLLSLAFVLVTELLDRRVRSVEDVSIGLGIPVLADLTHAKLSLIEKLKVWLHRKNNIKHGYGSPQFKFK